MSIVTNVLICGHDVDEHVDDVNKWLDDNDHYPIGYIDPCNAVVGGEKCLEIRVLIGAFNHLDLDDFISGLSAIDWGYDRVDLFVKEDDDDPICFRRFVIFEGR